MLLTSARLIFREYTLEDFALVHAIDADPEVTKMRGGTAIHESRYRERFQTILGQKTATPRHHYDLVVLRHLTQPLIGHCYLHITNFRTGEAEIGYFLHPSAWGQGFATEAAARLLQFGFNDLLLHRISSGCIATNTVSAHVLEKVGMRYEGRLREDRLTDAGKRFDTLLYAMLRHEWHDNERITG
ncbi:MAG: GNAT family N-acetyltransferase [Chloroflexaceae bacterium]|jgi:RimJ/RimL family protein N-acetyltransferase|nr:GNAT family N-acetyltransferase [Chloroflexaceae bacterium]